MVPSHNFGHPFSHVSLYAETTHSIGELKANYLPRLVKLTQLLLLESSISNFGQNQDCLQIDNDFFI